MSKKVKEDKLSPSCLVILKTVILDHIRQIKHPTEVEIQGEGPRLRREVSDALRDLINDGVIVPHRKRHHYTVGAMDSLGLSEHIRTYGVGKHFQFIDRA